ncbi:hypothetical protein NKH99_07975 [Mesorhizobium sp. M0854]|uniref:hypothetical protein n=1 Tax=Mesorhizobium sp. M0854 TaxID=2957013 RepID=UPI003335AA7C
MAILMALFGPETNAGSRREDDRCLNARPALSATPTIGSQMMVGSKVAAMKPKTREALFSAVEGKSFPAPVLNLRRIACSDQLKKLIAANHGIVATSVQLSPSAPSNDVTTSTGPTVKVAGRGAALPIW